MKTELILSRIKSTLSKRTDFCEASVKEANEGKYLFAILASEVSSNHQIIFLPLLRNGGACLRVCHLNAGFAPEFINSETLCSILNDPGTFGHFVTTDLAKGFLPYVVHHMLSDGNVNSDIVNRLLSDVLAASALCHRLVQKLVERARKQRLLFSALQAGDPALN